MKKGIDDPFSPKRSPRRNLALRLPFDERLDRVRDITDPYEPKVDAQDSDAGIESESSTVTISSSSATQFSLSREVNARPSLSLPI